jgi:hypothetical protein
MLATYDVRETLAGVSEEVEEETLTSRLMMDKAVSRYAP